MSCLHILVGHQVDSYYVIHYFIFSFSLSSSHQSLLIEIKKIKKKKKKLAKAMDIKNVQECGSDNHRVKLYTFFSFLISLSSTTTTTATTLFEATIVCDIVTRKCHQTYATQHCAFFGDHYPKIIKIKN